MYPLQWRLNWQETTISAPWLGCLQTNLHIHVHVTLYTVQISEYNILDIHAQQQIYIYSTYIRTYMQGDVNTYTGMHLQ